MRNRLLNLQIDSNDGTKGSNLDNATFKITYEFFDFNDSQVTSKDFVY